jgi:hypothetical protein
MDEYLESLRRASGLKCHATLPAHGPPLPEKALRQTLEHRLEREARVCDALSDEPREPAAIAGEAYRDTPDAPAALAEMQTLAHLIRLERESRAARQDDAGRLWIRAGSPPS